MILFINNHIKANLLFFVILNSLVLSRGYGQSTPPPAAKSKTQEVTSVMQESQVIGALKAQKSLTSTAVCDHDGDDRHCPPITPEKHHFYIRTGTPMSCANSGATSFLSSSGISFLNINEADIIDKRSTSNLLFRSDRSEEHREQFPGNARIKFSLVAWTTVESKDQKININAYDYSSISLYEKFNIWNHIFQPYYFRTQWHQFFKHSLNADVVFKFNNGYYLNHFIMTQKNRGNFGFALQKLFIKHFKKRQKFYNKLGSVEEIKRLNSRQDKFVPINRPAKITELPSLSGKVHTIAYDDNVIANGGEALLKCINQTPEKSSPTFFDTKLSDDEKVCLNSSQWQEKKANESPEKIAIRNKKMLYQYFKHAYGSKGTPKPWKGLILEEPNFSSYLTKIKSDPPTSSYARQKYFYHVNNNHFVEDPRLVYSTHFAVQSCKEYLYDNTSSTQSKTADQVIKEINKEINIVESLIDSNEKINAINSKLYQLFEKYMPQNLDTPLDTPESIPPSNNRNTFDGKKHVLTNVFFGLFFYVKKMYQEYMTLKGALETNCANLPRFGNADCKLRMSAIAGGGITLNQRLYGYSFVNSGHHFEPYFSPLFPRISEYKIKHNSNYILEYLNSFLASQPSCYWARIKILAALKRVLYADAYYDNNTFYTDQQKDLISNKIIAYSPKWWEHTNLGASCRLLAISTKNITPFARLDINFDLNNALPETKRFQNLPIILNENIDKIEKIMEALKVVIGLEILQEQYQHQGPKNKTCSPNTGTDEVNEEATPPTPEWHNMYSSAVLDMRQNFNGEDTAPFKIFSSEHPAKNLSSDAVKKYLMTKDPRYITFYSSSSKFEENYHPGLPMIFIPGIDYVAPEIVADQSSSPPKTWSGKHGISVYSYPPATCAPSSVTLKKERPRRLWN